MVGPLVASAAESSGLARPWFPRYVNDLTRTREASHFDGRAPFETRTRSVIAFFPTGARPCTIPRGLIPAGVFEPLALDSKIRQRSSDLVEGRNHLICRCQQKEVAGLAGAVL